MAKVHQRGRTLDVAYQRIKDVEGVSRGGEDVSALRLSQQSALCVKKEDQSVCHKVKKRNKSPKDCRRIKDVERVSSRAKDVSALHLSQKGARGVKNVD